MGELVRSGSGDAENSGNVCHVHHQRQFFQRVILFLVHLASFLPCWESKLVFEWPKRITQSKFFILFSSRRMVGGRGVCLAQTCTDAYSPRKIAHVGTTRPMPRSKWLRRCEFSDLCRFNHQLSACRRHWGQGSPCKLRFGTKTRCLRFSCAARKV